MPESRASSAHCLEPLQLGPPALLSAFPAHRLLATIKFMSIPCPSCHYERAAPHEKQPRPRSDPATHVAPSTTSSCALCEHQLHITTGNPPCPPMALVCSSLWMSLSPMMPMATQAPPAVARSADDVLLPRRSTSRPTTALARMICTNSAGRPATSPG